MKIKAVLIWSIALIVGFSCKKEDDAKTIPDNNAPYYDQISTIQVKNYVNRLYIDLIGREPLNVEMDADVQWLRDNNLNFETRDSLIIRLQTDTTFIEGDTSYRAAYCQRFYELTKTKMIEAASDAYVRQEMGPIKFGIRIDSLEGNLLSVQLKMEKLARLENILKIKNEFQSYSITINEVFARLLDNPIYDQINMNTFNFLRASFNDLYLRFPTGQEYNLGYEMIEYNKPSKLFGISGQSKSDYIDIIVNSPEFYEGLIRWSFQYLLAREPSSEEVYKLIESFRIDGDIMEVQREILKSDEYANF